MERAAFGIKCGWTEPGWLWGKTRRFREAGGDAVRGESGTAPGVGRKTGRIEGAGRGAKTAGACTLAADCQAPGRPGTSREVRGFAMFDWG